MSVILETSKGDIVVDLYTKTCPKSCENFLKLCKLKFYNDCCFYNVQRRFLAQAGDPSDTGRGGASVWGVLEWAGGRRGRDGAEAGRGEGEAGGPEPPTRDLREAGRTGRPLGLFADELWSGLKHDRKGLLCTAGEGDGADGRGGPADSKRPPEGRNASQFYLTTAPSIASLDGKHTVFGHVAEGMQILNAIDEVAVDGTGRPLQNIRIRHTIVLDDPFDDPPGLAELVPPVSPPPTFASDGRLEDDWDPLRRRRSGDGGGRGRGRGGGGEAPASSDGSASSSRSDGDGSSGDDSGATDDSGAEPSTDEEGAAAAEARGDEDPSLALRRRQERAEGRLERRLARRRARRRARADSARAERRALREADREAAGEARSRAVVLEMLGDLPDADAAPPDSVLFVARLNPITREEDLDVIFGRFGRVVECSLPRDPITGQSLSYAFVGFDSREAAEKAYLRMNNTLVDDRRIKVDFSQSVAHLWRKHRAAGGRPARGGGGRGGGAPSRGPWGREAPARGPGRGAGGDPSLASSPPRVVVRGADPRDLSGPLLFRPRGPGERDLAAGDRHGRQPSGRARSGLASSPPDRSRDEGSRHGDRARRDADLRRDDRSRRDADSRRDEGSRRERSRDDRSRRDDDSRRDEGSRRERSRDDRSRRDEGSRRERSRDDRSRRDDDSRRDRSRDDRSSNDRSRRNDDSRRERSRGDRSRDDRSRRHDSLEPRDAKRSRGGGDDERKYYKAGRDEKQDR